MGVMDTEVIAIIMAACFIAGMTIGLVISPTVPREFSCTESAVIEGYATCVKYERNK